jgi:hypothetical protein
MEPPFGLELFKEKIMFISKIEKDQMSHKIASLELSLSSVCASLRILEDKITKLQEKPKKQTTAVQRAKQREYMRKYKARKKAEKAAQQVVA